MAKRKKAEKVVADKGLVLNSVQLETVQRLVGKVGLRGTDAAVAADNAQNAVEELDRAIGALVDFFADLEEANDAS